jgi:hypothetical protein
MASQAEIQAGIDEIVTGAQYPAIKMRPLLTSMLDFSSAGQTQVFDGLVANNTTMEDTTLVLDYGMNIVVTATNVDYACRLPVPTTGKRITIVNNSLMTVFLFPDYNEGVAGRINNYTTGQPAIIPPDGNAYDFTCIDNPLPGAWVWSPPAIAQYDSGDITGTTIDGASVIIGVQTGISTVSNLPTFGGQVNASPSVNTPISPLGYAYNVNAGFSADFKPIGVGNNWNAITKIKVYTNISSNVGAGQLPKFSISGSWGINKYELGSDPLDYNNYLGTYPGGGFTYVSVDLDQVVPGTVPAPGVTANVGDPGTCYKLLTIGVDYIFPDPLTTGQSSIVGDKYIGVGTYTFGPSTEPCDDYMSQVLAGNLQGGQAAVGVKYRFFFEYM